MLHSSNYWLPGYERMTLLTALKTFWLFELNSLECRVVGGSWSSKAAGNFVDSFDCGAGKRSSPHPRIQLPR